MQEYNESSLRSLDERVTANRMKAQIEERRQALWMIVGWCFATAFTTAIFAYFLYNAGSVALWLAPVYLLYGGPIILLSEIVEFLKDC